MNIVHSAETGSAGRQPEVHDWMASDRHAKSGSRLGVVRRLATAEHLYFEGDARRSLFVIESGVVGLYKLTRTGQRQICRFLFPGDIAGLGGTERHTNGAEALCVTQAFSIAIDVIERRVREQPEFALALLQESARELDETQDRLLILGRQCALEKLAGFLVRLSTRNQRLGRDPACLHLAMKRCDIADYLGLTIETVSRNFTALRRAGLISTRTDGTVQILNRRALAAVADAEERKAA